jgi:hypothetical protein
VWAPYINQSDNAAFGFMNNNSSNPVGEWNMIFVPYCDGKACVWLSILIAFDAAWMAGTSYTSNRANPIQYQGKNVWFRGRNIIDALLYELDQMGHLLTQATDVGSRDCARYLYFQTFVPTQVVITGTSAGGLATYLHSSYIKSRLPASAKVVAMPDAGYFLDYTNFNGQYAFRSNFQNAYGPNLWNATSGTHQGCIADKPAAEQWRCFFTQVQCLLDACNVFKFLCSMSTRTSKTSPYMLSIRCTTLQASG